MSVSLVLGSFDLISVGDDYETSVLAEGTSRGVPVPIEVAVKSWLQDGAIVVTQGYDNREVRVRVRFHGDDLVSLAEAEAALFAELGKPNTLTWTPPDASPASVFQVVTSSLEAEDDDMGEIDPTPYRTYTVRLVCEAFVRSVDEVVTAALPVTGSTTVSVDSGSSATGWTATVNGASASPISASGVVGVLTSSLTGSVTISMTRTGSITTSTTKYLVVDWQSSTVAATNILWGYGDGVRLETVNTTPSPNAGFTRTVFYVAAASVSTLRLDFIGGPGPVASESFQRIFGVDSISRSDVTPTLGTARQLLRGISVTGSATTQGAIAIEHASSSLGDVLAYLWQDDGSGYIPALRTTYSVTSSPVPTSDSSLVSGGRVTLNPGMSFLIPPGRLPQGSYVLMARLRSTTASATVVDYSLPWGISAANLAGSQYLGPVLSKTAAVSLSGTVWSNIALGTAILPPVDVFDTSGTLVALTIGANASVQLDEAWLFNRTIGSLISVECGTGTPVEGGPTNRLFIEPASITRPRPSIMRGTSASKQDAFHAGTAIKSFDTPRIEAGMLSVFTATSGATDASVSLRHYPHWHTHAAS